jgi:hypothetical protein
VTINEDGLSGEEATALAVERGLGYFRYGDLLSLVCQACHISWEPAQPWHTSDFACPNRCPQPDI